MGEPSQPANQPASQQSKLANQTTNQPANQATKQVTNQRTSEPTMKPQCARTQIRSPLGDRCRFVACLLDAVGPCTPDMLSHLMHSHAARDPLRWVTNKLTSKPGNQATSQPTK
jgi:hypothetical protein